jgi:hypothetical protein
LGHPVEAGGNGGQALLELESPRLERGLAAIGERASNRRTVPADDLGRRVGAVLHLPLDLAYPAYPLAQFLLRVAIRFPNRPTGFSQIMKLAELMRDSGKNLGHRLAQGLLAVADDPHHRQVFQPRHRRPQQRAQIVATRCQQAARQQDVPRQHLPHHPQDFMPLVRLQAIHRQDQPALLAQARPLRRRRQHHAHQFLIARQQMIHGPRRDRHPPSDERLVNLGRRVMVLVPTGPHPGDDVQAKLVMRQR